MHPDHGGEARSNPADGARVVPAGAGELLGEVPDRRVELLCDEAPAHVTRARFGPGREGADLHVHREHADVFFVLDGELTLRLGAQDDLVALPAGALALVPPLVVHGFRNAADAAVSYLNLHAPGAGFATYMRGLRDGRRVSYDQHEPPPDGGRSPDDVQVAAREAAAPPVRLLAQDEHLAIKEIRAVAGSPLGPSGPPRALEALFVLDGALAGDGWQAGPGAWVRLPADPDRRAVVVAGAAAARVLHVAAGG